MNVEHKIEHTRYNIEKHYFQHLCRAVAAAVAMVNSAATVSIACGVLNLTIFISTICYSFLAKAYSYVTQKLLNISIHLSLSLLSAKYYLQH